MVIKWIIMSLRQKWLDEMTTGCAFQDKVQAMYRKYQTKERFHFYRLKIVPSGTFLKIDHPIIVCI